jgi:hypothetical protein
MTWILITAPLMLLAIAVLPVLLFSLRESRPAATAASSVAPPRTIPLSAAHAYDSNDELAA